jgi:hypothetical protein
MIVLTRKLADGATLTVVGADGGWYWSAVAADGTSARYSRRFASRDDALRDAMQLANLLPPRGAQALDVGPAVV